MNDLARLKNLIGVRYYHDEFRDMFTDITYAMMDFNDDIVRFSQYYDIHDDYCYFDSYYDNHDVRYKFKLHTTKDENGNLAHITIGNIFYL